jgi:ABC-type ATPase with predicted acetyltransferase domain
MRNRRDRFRIRTCRRTYDRIQGKFSFNISYETHTKITPRSLVVAEAFGLGIDEAQKFKVLDAELKIGPYDIVYITGDSSSGKSVLLRAIRADLGEEAIDLSEVSVDPEKPLIETVGTTVEQGLELRRLPIPTHLQPTQRRTKIPLQNRQTNRIRQTMVANGRIRRMP